MNYAEVKAKYTTVESIDNRLNEIDELTKVGAEKYTSAFPVLRFRVKFSTLNK